MNHLSIAAHTYPYIWHETFEDTLRRMAHLGQRKIEAIVNPPHLWPSEMSTARRSDVKNLLSELELQVVSLNCPSLDLNLVSPSEEVRRYSLDHYLQVVGLARDLDVQFVCAIPGKIHPLLSAPRAKVADWLHEALQTLSAAANDLGVRLLVENFPGGFLPRAVDLRSYLDERGLSSVGVVYDVANGVFVHEDPADGIRDLGDRLGLIHLSDTGWEIYAHDDIGTGVVPFDRVAETLRSTNFAGTSVLEVITPDPLRADAALDTNLRALANLGFDVDGRSSTGH